MNHELFNRSLFALEWLPEKSDKSARYNLCDSPSVPSIALPHRPPFIVLAILQALVYAHATKARGISLPPVALALSLLMVLVASWESNGGHCEGGGGEGM